LDVQRLKILYCLIHTKRGKSLRDLPLFLFNIQNLSSSTNHPFRTFRFGCSSRKQRKNLWDVRI